MAVRDDFAAGEVLAAADLNDTFASKLPYSYGTATPSTSDSGFLWYDDNDTPPTPKFWDGAAFQALTSGKILQVVRTVDTAATRQTTSTSLVDVPTMSVTITPTKTTSAVLLVASLIGGNFGGDNMRVAITDSSNNTVSGSESARSPAADTHSVTMIGYATPATTSATTYKLRFRVGTSGTANIYSATNATQLFAIEVAA